MLQLSSTTTPDAPALPARRVLCNSWPKAGTHMLLELARLAIGDGGWYAERDIKYPQGDPDFIRQADERLARHAEHALAIKGHFGRTSGIEAYLAANQFAHLFAVRDPREVLCSTWRWLRDLRPDWAISRHLAPLDPATQLEKIIRGLPLLHPFDADHAVRWDLPLPERYAGLSLWLDSPDCEVLAYEDLSGMRGVPAQFAAVDRALRRLAIPYDHTDIARIAGLICNPSATTFHTGPASDWQTVFTDRHRQLFVDLGGEALVERLGYPPTLPRRPRALRCVEQDAAGTAAEIDPGDELRAFVDQLGHFFGSPTALQIEFTEPPQVSITAHEAGASSALSELVSVPGDFPRLPLADGANEMVFNLGSLAALDDFALSVWLPELRRITRRHLWVALEASAVRDRAWWEARFIAAGFRKHPLSQCVVPYEQLDDEGGGLVLLLEPVAARVLHAHPPATPGAGSGAHRDMLRDVGPRSEAHLARYTLARNYVRPGQVVLDAACGPGDGCAVLATGTGAARVIGADPGESAIRCAQDLFGTSRPGLEFMTRDPSRLTGLADASVDLAICFDTLEHLSDPAGLLRELDRVLKPGGLFMGSMPSDWATEPGPDPAFQAAQALTRDPWHGRIPQDFACRQLYRQDGGGEAPGPVRRILRAIEGCMPCAEDLHGAARWIVVAEKPVTGAAQAGKAAADRP